MATTKDGFLCVFLALKDSSLSAPREGDATRAGCVQTCPVDNPCMERPQVAMRRQKAHGVGWVVRPVPVKSGQRCHLHVIPFKTLVIPAKGNPAVSGTFPVACGVDSGFAGMPAPGGDRGSKMTSLPKSGIGPAKPHLAYNGFIGFSVYREINFKGGLRNEPRTRA